MSAEFKWTTINPHLVLAPDEKNVIMTSIHWVRTAILDNLEVMSYGMVRLTNDSKPMRYEEYEKLTEKHILDILNKYVSVDQIDAELTEKLKRSNPPRQTTKPT